MKKINKKVAASVGLIAVLAVGGTFAYYTQTVSLDNPLSTGSYETQLVEEYTPPTDELIPGTTLDKEVGAVNTGDYPVLVRIKMDEQWALSDGSTYKLNSKDNYNVFEATQSDASPYISAQQLDAEDGMVNGDGSVVRKNLTEDVSVLYSTTASWVYGGDGYWYYNGVLAANGGETGALIDSITLASNIDLGKYLQKDYYYVGTTEPDADSTDWKEYWVVRDEDGWVTDIMIEDKDTSIKDQNDDKLINAIDMAIYLGITEDGDHKTDTLYRKNESLLDEEHTGYADATYTLLVTSDFVQATSDAVEAAWGYDVNKIKAMIAVTADDDGIYN